MSQKIENEPYKPFDNIRYCGAKTRQKTLCRAPALAGKTRCRLHGGYSSGPKSIEGKYKSSQNSFKHGFYSKNLINERKLIENTLKEFKDYLKEINSN